MKTSQCLLIKPVGELPFHLVNFTGAGVVSQCSGHLLVGHGFAVSLSTTPQLRQALLVLGGELESARSGLDPPDAAPH